MTAKDIVFVVVIPLVLAEAGPWCGWVAARLLPLASRLRYGDTDRGAVRLEEWSGDLDRTPGQLTKLAYAAGLLIAGTAASARQKAAQLTGQTGLPGADSSTITELERSAVVSALWRLPLRQREAIVLRYYDKLSEAQIAAIMRISRGAVRHHTTKGMSALRAVLEQVEERSPGAE